MCLATGGNFSCHLAQCSHCSFRRKKPSDRMKQIDKAGISCRLHSRLLIKEQQQANPSRNPTLSRCDPIKWRNVQVREATPTSRCSGCWLSCPPPDMTDSERNGYLSLPSALWHKNRISLVCFLLAFLYVFQSLLPVRYQSHLSPSLCNWSCRHILPQGMRLIHVI